MEIIEIITMLGGICGSIVTIVGFLTMVLKRPKNWIKNIVKEENEEKNEEVMAALKEIHEKIDKIQEDLNKRFEQNSETQRCILRHSIMDIYESCKNDKRLPHYVKEDLCYLYKNYQDLNGNSFIKTIFDEMQDWEIE